MERQFDDILRRFLKFSDDLCPGFASKWVPMIIYIIEKLRATLVAFFVFGTSLAWASDLLAEPKVKNEACYKLTTISSEGPNRAILQLIQKWLKTAPSKAQITILRQRLSQRSNPFEDDSLDTYHHLKMGFDLIMDKMGEIDWDTLTLEVGSLLRTEQVVTKEIQRIDEDTKEGDLFKELATNKIEHPNFTAPPQIFQMPDGKYYALLIEYPEMDDIQIPEIYQYFPETGEMKFIARIQLENNPTSSISIHRNIDKFELLDAIISPASKTSFLIRVDPVYPTLAEVDITTGHVIKTFEIPFINKQRDFKIQDVQMISKTEVLVTVSRLVDINQKIQLYSLDLETGGFKSLKEIDRFAQKRVYTKIELQENGHFLWFVTTNDVSFEVYSFSPNDQVFNEFPIHYTDPIPNDIEISQPIFSKQPDGTWLLFADRDDELFILKHDPKKMETLKVTTSEIDDLVSDHASLMPLSENKFLWATSYVKRLEFRQFDAANTELSLLGKYRSKEALSEPPILFSSREGRHYALVRTDRNTYVTLMLDPENQSVVALDSKSFDTYKADWVSKDSLVSTQRLSDGRIQIFEITPERHIRVWEVKQ